MSQNATSDQGLYGLSLIQQFKTNQQIDRIIYTILGQVWYEVKASQCLV